MTIGSITDRTARCQLAATGVPGVDHRAGPLGLPKPSRRLGRSPRLAIVTPRPEGGRRRAPRLDPMPVVQGACDLG